MKSVTTGEIRFSTAPLSLSNFLHVKFPGVYANRFICLFSFPFFSRLVKRVARKESRVTSEAGVYRCDAADQPGNHGARRRDGARTSRSFSSIFTPGSLRRIRNRLEFPNGDNFLPERRLAHLTTRSIRYSGFERRSFLFTCPTNAPHTTSPPHTRISVRRRN